MRFQLNGKYEYCPNGNHWEEVSGIFDKSIYLFCDCNICKGAVYKLKPFNVTKKVSKASIEKYRQFKKLEDIRNKININNMETINKVLKA